MIDFIKRHKLSILFITLFFLSINIYSSNIKSKKDLNGFQRLILDATLPVQKLIGNISSSFYSAIDNYIFLFDVKKENVALKQKLTKLSAKVEELKEIKIANERLRNLLEFKKTLQNEAVSAEVVAKGASSWLNTIIIDKGKKHGILPGLAVVTEKGIVGHTIYTTNNFAQVLLIIDNNSGIDVINRRSRAKGIAKGLKDSLCKIDYLLNKEDVKIDDTIITSGMDGIYPKGLLVGKVISVTKSDYELFQNTIVEPFVDFDKLEEVLVIIKKEELLDEMHKITQKNK